MKLLKYFLLPVFLTPVIANAAAVETNADFPVGLWKTSHYRQNDDGSLKTTPALITVCVQADGTWQTLKNGDDLQGKWVRNGNNVHLAGNGPAVAGTGDLNLITPYKLMTGSWQSWKLDNPTGKRASFTSKWELSLAKTCTTKK
jgi:hypothetical protein